MLWVDDSEGNEVAVVPVAPRGTGDGRVQVLHVRRPDPPDTVPPPDRGDAAFDGVLDAQASISEKAFGEQYRKIALAEVDGSDPLSNASLPQ